MRSLALPAREDEQMDAVDLDPSVYARVLTDLAGVNRMTFAARPTLDFVRRAIGDHESFRLLDVGFGDGDLLRAIAAWAEKRGVRAQLVGIDLNPGSAGIARSVTSAKFDITYLTGDYLDHLDHGFDLVVSSLVAHHMSHEQLLTFLRAMETKAERGWHINDLHRHRFAYLGFPLLARLMRWHRIVREDGQLSIARAMRPSEWRSVLDEAGFGDEVRILRRFPFRICVERLR